MGQAPEAERKTGQSFRQRIRSAGRPALAMGAGVILVGLMVLVTWVVPDGRANPMSGGPAPETPRVEPTALPPTQPPSLPASMPPPSPSGEDMPVGDIPGWRQVFTEDFNTDVPIGSFPGSAYSAKWWAYPDGWKDTTKHGTYVASKVLSVHGGMLDYFIHTENGVHMAAAPVAKVTAGSPYGQTYGRYAIRFRADSISGYKTAFLLWPDSENWPIDGEIDFPEGDLNSTIDAAAHHASNREDQKDLFLTRATYTDWHTAVIEWLPGKVSFYLDDRLIGVSTTRVPSGPMHWVLQAETSTSRPLPPLDSVQGHIQVDWVVAYVPS